MAQFPLKIVDRWFGMLVSWCMMGSDTFILNCNWGEWILKICFMLPFQGIQTPRGQKRTCHELLPSPEPSPKGSYVGQHSQGIGGHYMDSHLSKRQCFSDHNHLGRRFWCLRSLIAFIFANSAFYWDSLVKCHLANHVLCGWSMVVNWMWWFQWVVNSSCFCS